VLPTKMKSMQQMLMQLSTWFRSGEPPDLKECRAKYKLYYKRATPKEDLGHF